MYADEASLKNKGRGVNLKNQSNVGCPLLIQNLLKHIISFFLGSFKHNLDAVNVQINRHLNQVVICNTYAQSFPWKDREESKKK